MGKETTESESENSIFIYRCKQTDVLRHGANGP